MIDTIIRVKAGRFVYGLPWRGTFSLHDEVNDETQCVLITRISTTNTNEGAHRELHRFFCYPTRFLCTLNCEVHTVHSREIVISLSVTGYRKSCWRLRGGYRHIRNRKSLFKSRSALHHIQCINNLKRVVSPLRSNNGATEQELVITIPPSP